MALNGWLALRRIARWRLALWRLALRRIARWRLALWRLATKCPGGVYTPAAKILARCIGRNENRKCIDTRRDSFVPGRVVLVAVGQDIDLLAAVYHLAVLHRVEQVGGLVVHVRDAQGGFKANGDPPGKLPVVLVGLYNRARQPAARRQLATPFRF